MPDASEDYNAELDNLCDEVVEEIPQFPHLLAVTRDVLEMFHQDGAISASTYRDFSQALTREQIDLRRSRDLHLECYMKMIRARLMSQKR